MSRLLFSLMRCWVAGLVVLYGLQFLLDAVVDPLATPARLDSFNWRFALQHMPSVLATAAAALAAARLHRPPGCDSRPLHVLAVLAVPVVSAALNLASEWSTVRPDDIAMPVAALLFGGAIGLAVDQLREGRSEQDSSPAWGQWDRGATVAEYLGGAAIIIAIVGAA